MIYLDSNATTRPADEVVEAVMDAVRVHWHNPSSMHRAGQEARRIVELARRDVAGLINARPRQVVFTSGGTEAIDLAIRGVLFAREDPLRKVVLTSSIEHEAVRDLLAALGEMAGVEVRALPVTSEGIVDPAVVEKNLVDRAALVTIQWANNETGAIQPVEEIGALCRERGVPFHCDGTQWVGKMPTDVESIPVDILTFASHKMHGVKGAGAAWVRRGVRVLPVIRGAQEAERRGGTENVPGIAGFGAAARLAVQWLEDPSLRTAQAALRDRLERGLLGAIPDAAVNGPADPAKRLWNTCNIGVPRLEAEPLLMLLSERGLCASAGAACSSGSLEGSPILRAMNVPPERAHGSVRFSLSRETTEAEIEEAIGLIVSCVERLRGSSAALT